MVTQREPPISLRDKALAAEIAQRGDQSGQIAKRDLSRYYDLLDQELAAVAFTEPEVMYMLGLGNDWLNQTKSYLLLRDRVLNNLRAEPPSVPDLDPLVLYEKVAKLTPGQCMAVIDALEGVFASMSRGSNEFDVSLRRLGLVQEACAPIRHVRPYQEAEPEYGVCPSCNRLLTYVKVPHYVDGRAEGVKLAGISSVSYLLNQYYEIRNRDGLEAAAKHIGFGPNVSSSHAHRKISFSKPQNGASPASG